MMTGGLILLAVGLSSLSTLMIGKFSFFPETSGYLIFGLIWLGFSSLFVGTALVVAYLFSRILKEKMEVEEVKAKVEPQKNPFHILDDWNLQLDFQRWLEGHQGASAGQILKEIKNLLATSKYV